MSSEKSHDKQKKLAKYMKKPVKFLTRIRDFYERGVSGCAGNAAFVGSMGPELGAEPSYFSKHSSRDEDMSELVRIAPTRSAPETSEAALRPSPSPRGVAAVAVLRSRTVAIGRIDEDKPCEFGGDVEVFYKSKSTASLRRRSIV